MGYLYDRWQSDSALVQGCTKRAEAYACTLQIVVPLADRASCDKGDPTTVTTSGRGGKGPGASFCSRFLIDGSRVLSVCRDWLGFTIVENLTKLLDC